MPEFRYAYVALVAVASGFPGTFHHGFYGLLRRSAVRGAYPKVDDGVSGTRGVEPRNLLVLY